MSWSSGHALKPTQLHIHHSSGELGWNFVAVSVHKYPNRNSVRIILFSWFQMLYYQHHNFHMVPLQNNPSFPLQQQPCPLWTIISQLRFHVMCEFNKPKSQIPKFPLLYHFFKWALAEKPAPCWQIWSPPSTTFILCWYLLIYVGHCTVVIYWPLHRVTSVFSNSLRLLINWGVL